MTLSNCRTCQLFSFILHEKNFKGDEINLVVKISSNSDGLVSHSININGFTGDKMAILNLVREGLVFIKADRGIAQKDNLEMGVLREWEKSDM